MATLVGSSAGLKTPGYPAANVGIRGLINEDVMQKIWDVSKIPLPFTDMVGSDSSKNSYKEWTTDELAAPDITNAKVDGADVTDDDTNVGKRVGNHHQISAKRVVVSTRAQESDTIGRANELAYQVMRRQQELRRDVDAIALNNQASVADDGDTTAGVTGGLPSWLETTVDGGTAGGFSASTGLTVARTVGNKQQLTETKVRDAVESVYNQGGDPTKMMSVPSAIRAFSEYMFTSSARVGTLMSDQGKSAEKATALGAVNVFVTDFGTLTMVPNRLQQMYDAADSTPTDKDACDVFILDPAYLGLCYLHGYKTEPLAKTGTADKRLMTVDWSLTVNTEKAHGMIGDVDPALGVAA